MVSGPAQFEKARVIPAPTVASGEVYRAATYRPPPRDLSNSNTATPQDSGVGMSAPRRMVRHAEPAGAHVNPTARGDAANAFQSANDRPPASTQPDGSVAPHQDSGVCLSFPNRTIQPSEPPGTHVNPSLNSNDPKRPPPRRGSQSVDLISELVRVAFVGAKGHKIHGASSVSEWVDHPVYAVNWWGVRNKQPNLPITGVTPTKILISERSDRWFLTGGGLVDMGELYVPASRQIEDMNSNHRSDFAENVWGSCHFPPSVTETLNAVLKLGVIPGFYGRIPGRIATCGLPNEVQETREIAANCGSWSCDGMRSSVPKQKSAIRRAPPPTPPIGLSVRGVPIAPSALIPV